MPAFQFTKRASDRLDYDIDFDDWLLAGDTIQAAVADVEGSTSIVVDTLDTAATTLKVWVSGGVIGEQAVITVTATTTEGRVKAQSFTMKIRGA